MELVGRHRRLPDLALGDLTVAQDGVDAEALLRLLAGQRHADGNGDALAQRAGGHIDAGVIVHLDVAGHVAVDAAEHLQVLDREEAAQREDRIERRGTMALGHDETVTVGVVRVLGVDAHLAEIEISQHVHAAERAARMAGRCVMHHFHGQQSGLRSRQFQLRQFGFFHVFPFLCCRAEPVFVLFYSGTAVCLCCFLALLYNTCVDISSPFVVFLWVLFKTVVFTQIRSRFL